MNHLNYFSDWNITRKSKLECVDSLLNVINDDENKLEELKQWLSTFTIDGRNNYYIFNYKEKEEDIDISNIVNNIEVEDILCIDIYNIETSKIIHKNLNDDRLIIRFISPADQTVKSENEHGDIEYTTEKTFYFASVFLDLKLKQIIVSIPHTTGIKNVNNVEAKARDFSGIAKYYLEEVFKYIPNIRIVKCDEWINDALYEFAEEGTAHNNPKINEKYEENIDIIDKFVKELMKKSGIENVGMMENLKIDIGIQYETMLIEEFGIVESDDQYSAFIQDGDEVNSFFKVGSKTSSLKSGRASALAKTARNNSDLITLGVMKKFNGIVFKFLIEIIDKETYVIKTDTSKFIEERVIYNVIRKVGGYKETLSR
jgi:hypothetical protein